MEKNKQKVRIQGREYIIVGYESQEYLNKIAFYIDKKMDEIRKNNTSLSTNMIAVLTSINIADDLIKAKEYIKMLEEELKKNE